MLSSLLLLCGVAAAPLSSLRAPQIQTSSGLLLGSSSSLGTRYLGVPYAMPPTGPYRFRSARALHQPHEVVNATAQGFICPQAAPYYPSTMNEDCLNLDLYVPAHAKSLPVLVFFYGGSLYVGSNSDPVFDASYLSHEQNAIVVTVNYRLGTLGFYNGEDTDTNVVLSDAVTALSWINTNIAAFGGNPDQLLAFGQSSGATLVRALTTINQSNTLFTRALLQSDPFKYPEVTKARSAKLSGELKKASNCTSTQCMRSLSLDDILNGENSFIDDFDPILSGEATPFNFVVDGSLVPDTFQNLITASKLAFKGPMICGTVKDETGPAVSSVAPGLNETAFRDILQSVLGNNGLSNALSSTLYSLVQTLSPIDALEKITTKYIFECPAQLAAAALARTRPTFVYRFDQGLPVPDNTDWWFCQNKDTACHESDLPIVFFNGKIDVSFGKQVRTDWAQFAKTGSPVNWPQVSGTSPLVHDFGGDSFKGGYSDPFCWIFHLGGLLK